MRTDAYQACVEGLEHGKRFEVTVRDGLPSAVGEALLKPATLSIYVRDRAAAVRFTGRNYVLPSRGQQGIPLISVNTDTLNVRVLRIGDRGLTRSVLDGEFQRSMNNYRIDELANNRAIEVWSGELSVKKILNRDVTTAFPVNETIGALKPGVYVMFATAKDSKAEHWTDRATQWFIVSDLALTALKGRDGVHAVVRSLATAETIADAKVRLIARNNDVLATTTTDPRGYARFAAGLARGKGGLAPALVVAETEAGDYAFLDLTASAFDLTDRGVGGRSTPGPLDAFIFTERGIYRPGATVHATALLRRGNTTAASGIPLTLIVTRPDGVGA